MSKLDDFNVAVVAAVNEMEQSILDAGSVLAGALPPPPPPPPPSVSPDGTEITPASGGLTDNNMKSWTFGEVGNPAVAAGNAMILKDGQQAYSGWGTIATIKSGIVWVKYRDSLAQEYWFSDTGSSWHAENAPPF